MGRRSEARAAGEVAIAAARNQLNADPRDAVVRANLGYLHAEAGDRAEAGRQIHLALADAPMNVRVRFTAALVFELTGRRNEALEALSSAIDRGNPKYQVAHHPDLRDLRSDDRYTQLLERVGWKR
jgi:eukaryotic-like serine/threonine-protein kinase